jgi:outer membrane protein assembly factor BamE (lipoprotein component of BamABCDE complex)
MTAILRAALFAALTAASIPAVAAGQSISADSLRRQVDLLERRTTDLERRVRELEALIKVEPSRDRRVSTSPNWRDLQNWRRLRLGMTEDEVRALLGDPERVDAGPVTYWHWTDANVYFMRGKLEGWSEPRR